MTLLEPKSPWPRMALIIVLGAVFTIVSFQVARALDERRIAYEVDLGAANRVSAIQRSLTEQRRLLESVAAYWTASGGTDPSRFGAFVTPLLSHSPELAAIGWAPLVAAGEREATEAAMRRQGLDGYRIVERGPDGALVPAGGRDFHVPVAYIEPVPGNEPAIGFDLWSEEYRRAALQAARDSGAVHTTRRLRLVQEQRPRDGLLSALALYRPGSSTDTVEARREALTGFITQVYWVDDVIEGGLASLQPLGIDLYFLDPAEGVDAAPVYVHHSRTREEPLAPPWSPPLVEQRPVHTGALDVGGRNWRVVSVPTRKFVTDRRGPLPWVLFAVGVLATAVGVVAVWNSERRATRLGRANARLKASEQRLRNVVENMPVLMAALDSDGRIIAWNRQCERVLGYTAQAVIEQGELDRAYPQAWTRDSRFAELSRSDYVGQDRTLIAKDGGEHVISWSKVSNAIPIPGWAAWLIGIDVTQRNLAEQERRDMQAQLLESQKLESLGLLAGGIAHDFNNLLTAILGNASLALDSVAADSPAGSALDGVVQASNRAALLTQQLLAYTGRGTLEKLPLDVSGHVREIGDLLQAAIPKKVDLEFDLRDDLPAVGADPGQLQQLVMNLVINAAEAADEKAGLVTVRTGVEEVDVDLAKSLPAGEELQPGKYVYVEVTDNGHGMDEETRARIFDPFFSTKFTGRGLGLSAVLGIVRAHGGRLAVTSAPGEGSVFKIYLPASSEAPRQRPADRVQDLHGTGTVLVVDDESIVRRLATRVLTGLGYRVVTAADGVEAVDIFRAQADDIDCVLLDMTMPRLDGRETFRALRSRKSDVPIIVSTGYDEMATAQQFEDDRPAGFLLKPYGAAALGDKVKGVLAAWRDRGDESKRTGRPAGNGVT